MKPREFWIWDNGMSEKPVETEPPDEPTKIEVIHVIEHEVYAQAIRHLELVVQCCEVPECKFKREAFEWLTDKRTLP